MLVLRSCDITCIVALGGAFLNMYVLTWFLKQCLHLRGSYLAPIEIFLQTVLALEGFLFIFYRSGFVRQDFRPVFPQTVLALEEFLLILYRRDLYASMFDTFLFTCLDLHRLA